MNKIYHYLTRWRGEGTLQKPYRPPMTESPDWTARDLRTEGIDACLVTLQEPLRDRCLQRLFPSDRGLLALVTPILCREGCHIWNGQYWQRVLAGGAGPLATEDFSGTLGNWTTVTSETAFTIVSGQAKPSNGSLDAVMYYSAISWPANQYSQAAESTDGTNNGAGAGISLRCSSVAQTYYWCVVNRAGSNNLTVTKAVAGAHTQLGQRTVTGVDGQIVYCEVQGTTLLAKYNGTQAGATISDSAIASGSAGIAYSSSLSDANLDTWEGGDFAAAVADLTGAFIMA